MAIDRLAKRQEEERKLTQFIGDRPIEDELANIRTGVKATRAGLLPQLEAQAPGVQVGRAFQSEVPQLERQVGSQVDRLRREQELQKFNLIFNNAFELATQYGMDVREAEQYANRIAEQQQEQEFIGGESEKEREDKREQNRLANIYSQKGLDLEQEYAPQSDYNGALMRALIGTGTALATGYAMRGKTPTQKPNIPNVVGEGATLRQQSGFALPISGRKPSLNIGSPQYNFPQTKSSFGGFRRTI